MDGRRFLLPEIGSRAVCIGIFFNLFRCPKLK